MEKENIKVIWNDVSEKIKQERTNEIIAWAEEYKKEYDPISGMTYRQPIKDLIKYLKQ